MIGLVENAVQHIRFMCAVMLAHAFDRCCAVSNRLHELVGVCESRIGDWFVLELYCVTETVTIGCFDVAFVSAVVFR